MIKSNIIHPELISTLAKCGHKTKILIADSNYSFVTNSSPNAIIIYLNLSPGMINATDILDALLTEINVESAILMDTPADFNPEIYQEYKDRLSAEVEFTSLERYAFYNTAKSDDLLLVIASGEKRRFANIILTVGAIK